MTCKKIIFFDGVCGLCNKTVNFLMSVDKRQNLRFAPLQGDTAKNHLPAEIIEDLNTLVFYEDGELTNRSTAVLRALKAIGGFCGLLYVGIIIPRPLRDWIYKIVAKNRYKWFGEHETCRMPTPEERGRLLP